MNLSDRGLSKGILISLGKRADFTLSWVPEPKKIKEKSKEGHFDFEALVPRVISFVFSKLAIGQKVTRAHSPNEKRMSISVAWLGVYIRKFLKIFISISFWYKPNPNFLLISREGEISCIEQARLPRSYKHALIYLLA